MIDDMLKVYMAPSGFHTECYVWGGGGGGGGGA